VATEVIMPALGMAQDTGKILRWHKSEGDEVAKGDALMEVETDKVTVDVEAPADGRLAAVSAGVGENVPVGRAVALILAPGDKVPAAAASEADAPAAGPAESQRAPVTAAPATAEAATAATTAGNGPSAGTADRAPGRGRRPLASPKARRLASRLGVDLAAVSGSGPRGAVIAADVEALAAANGEPATAALAPAAAEQIPVGSLWTRMAERMVESWQSAPHFFLARDVDASRLVAWREALRRRPGGERVTHTDLLVRVVAAALAEHPRVNARWDGGAILAPGEVNVGIAVALDDGLVVPVVHRADRLGVAEIAARRRAIVDAARGGRLRPEDVTGGTFTLSNLGMYGVDAFAAVLNPPQAAILAVGRIADRVVAVGGAPAVRPMTTRSLSLDHRVVDGARAARFLDTLADLLEEPMGLVS
jgi:pyruvate dehydrogenase E2 component (dihydrolipoamide acetyltransferase)